MAETSQVDSLERDKSHWDKKIVRTYVHHSDMQRRWAMAFLIPFLKSLEGREHILDIGCGDGRITADVSRFVPNGTVKGIDPSEAMLDWAKKQYHPYEYSNVSFQKGGFLEPGCKDTYDLVISCSAFQACSDQKKALCTIAHLVKSGGKLLMTLPAGHNSAWNQAVKNTQSRAKWSQYWANSATKTGLDPNEYAQILESNGFGSVQIEHHHTIDPFVDRDELIEMWLGVYPSVLPADLERQFFCEVIEEYLTLDPKGISPAGTIYLRCGYITVIAEKRRDPCYYFLVIS